MVGYYVWRVWVYHEASVFIGGASDLLGGGVGANRQRTVYWRAGSEKE
jgi:hypothetical protein